MKYEIKELKPEFRSLALTFELTDIESSINILNALESTGKFESIMDDIISTISKTSGKSIALQIMSKVNDTRDDSGENVIIDQIGSDYCNDGSCMRANTETVNNFGNSVTLTEDIPVTETYQEPLQLFPPLELVYAELGKTEPLDDQAISLMHNTLLGIVHEYNYRDHTLPLRLEDSILNEPNLQKLVDLFYPMENDIAPVHRRIMENYEDKPKQVETGKMGQAGLAPPVETMIPTNDVIDRVIKELEKSQAVEEVNSNIAHDQIQKSVANMKNRASSEQEFQKDDNGFNIDAKDNT